MMLIGKCLIFQILGSNVQFHLRLGFYDICDDQLNFLINKINAKGFCAIIDACYSGGFNDYQSALKKNMPLIKTQVEKTNLEWPNSFAKELSSPGRVILMSSAVSEQSQNGCFTYFAIEGFQGKADENHDGMCSAEEVFNYAAFFTESWLKEYKNWDQHPQIYDDYPGDLVLTDVESPPNNPIQVEEINIGIVNNEHHFLFQCVDKFN